MHDLFIVDVTVISLSEQSLGESLNFLLGMLSEVAIRLQNVMETVILQCSTIRNVSPVVMLGELTISTVGLRAVGMDVVEHGKWMSTKSWGDIFDIPGLDVTVIRQGELSLDESIVFILMKLYESVLSLLQGCETVILPCNIIRNVLPVVMLGELTIDTVGQVVAGMDVVEHGK